MSTKEMPEGLQLGGGILLRDVDSGAAATGEELTRLVKQAISEGKLLGLTRGSGTFTCKPVLRYPEKNRQESKGADIDRWEVTLSGTLVTVTAESLALCLPGAEVEKETGMTVIRPPQGLKQGDFLSSLCWAGRLGKGWLLIELRNALNVAGASLTFTERGEGKMPFLFRAHCEAGEDGVPCRVVVVEETLSGDA